MYIFKKNSKQRKHIVQAHITNWETALAHIIYHSSKQAAEICINMDIQHNRCLDLISDSLKWGNQNGNVENLLDAPTTFRLLPHPKFLHTQTHRTYPLKCKVFSLEVWGGGAVSYKILSFPAEYYGTYVVLSLQGMLGSHTACKKGITVI